MNLIISFKQSLLASALISTLLLSGCGGESSTPSVLLKSPEKAPSSSAKNLSSASSKIKTSSSAVSLSSSEAKSSAASSDAGNNAKSVFNKVSIPANSLLENIVAEPTQRDIWVYLPKQYFTSNAPLPVVYYLPGYGDSNMLDVAIPEDFDSSLKKLTPMIIVVVSGVNRYWGSFFADSPVTGNWGNFVAKDVVDYVDSHYRTLPHRSSRGLSGHSMGGFGALDLAMRRAEVFGSVFALSPGLVNSTGIADTQMFDSDAHIRDMVAATERLAAMQPAAVLSEMATSNFVFDFAYGMAFAPLPNPPYFEYPYTLNNNTLVRNDSILAKWESGFGNVHNEIQAFSQNLSSLAGIGLDCGSNDEYGWIARGCNHFDTELTAAGIAHSYTTHGGGHQDQIRARILTVMLPFFALRLATE